MRRLVSSVVLVAVAVAFAFVGTACDRDDDGGAVALDGSPRVPDAEGVVIAVANDFSEIELDGDRTYRLSKKLQSFSTSDTSTQPVRTWVGRYVHVGVDGDEVTWVAGVSTIDRRAERPTAFYIGVVDEIDGDRIVFRDGTVLATDRALDVPDEIVGRRYLATIDVEERAVVSLSPQ